MATTTIITGSGGLVGSESVKRFAALGHRIVGVDNDMRSYFFGSEASTRRQVERLKESVPNYVHSDADIRDRDALERIFAEYNTDIGLVVHTAAQPSHDWAAREPHTDFAINAVGTLNLLESVRTRCPNAVFIFCSTNKVYGDTPNALPLVELDTRWELPEDHPWFGGIDEGMSIDASRHSLFGASKAAADILVQEYGRYFDMKTACFRGGCLTGPGHSGAMLHGFLSYLMKCAVTGRHYDVFGYKAKQVRDNIHSADLVEAFVRFFMNPRSGAVYNMGGGRESNCSMLEAVAMCEKITGKPMDWSYSETNRIGDHIWWISGLGRFKADYPEWKITRNVRAILSEIYETNLETWTQEAKRGA